MIIHTTIVTMDWAKFKRLRTLLKQLITSMAFIERLLTDSLSLHGKTNLTLMDIQVSMRIKIKDSRFAIRLEGIFKFHRRLKIISMFLGMEVMSKMYTIFRRIEKVKVLLLMLIMTICLSRRWTRSIYSRNLRLLFRKELWCRINVSRLITTVITRIPHFWIKITLLNKKKS